MKTIILLSALTAFVYSTGALAQVGEGTLNIRPLPTIHPIITGK